MRREPVDSSETNLLRNAPRPSSSIELVAPCYATVGLRVADGRQAEGGGERVAHLDVALERDGDVLDDRHRREQPRVLERPAEAQRGPAASGDQRRDVLAVRR